MKSMQICVVISLVVNKVQTFLSVAAHDCVKLSPMLWFCANVFYRNFIDSNVDILDLVY